MVLKEKTRERISPNNRKKWVTLLKYKKTRKGMKKVPLQSRMVTMERSVNQIHFRMLRRNRIPLWKPLKMCHKFPRTQRHDQKVRLEEDMGILVR